MDSDDYAGYNQLQSYFYNPEKGKGRKDPVKEVGFLTGSQPVYMEDLNCYVAPSLDAPVGQGFLFVEGFLANRNRVDNVIYIFIGFAWNSSKLCCNRQLL
jgi:hypothetical protein